MSTNDPRSDQPLSRRRFLAMAGSGLALVTAAGCSLGPGSSPDSSRDPGADDGWAGELVEPGLEKPDVTLTDMFGEPFSIRDQSDGKFAFLFFGYTFCPDVCPIYLNTLARAIETIGTGPGSDVMVMFVGVDVARDTPEQLQRYLGRISSSFVGLTGSEADIAEANRQMFQPPIVIGEPDANGEYEVGHGKKAFPFGPDNLAHRIYPADDVRQQEWVRDLPKLAKGKYR